MWISLLSSVGSEKKRWLTTHCFDQDVLIVFRKMLTRKYRSQYLLEIFTSINFLFECLNAKNKSKYGRLKYNFVFFSGLEWNILVNFYFLDECRQRSFLNLPLPAWDRRIPEQVSCWNTRISPWMGKYALWSQPQNELAPGYQWWQDPQLWS